MSDHIPFKFEHLPNELFLEIFDYFKFNELISNFYDLNHRFNSLLFSSNIHLHILYPDDIPYNFIHEKILFKFLNNQKFIARLNLSNGTILCNQKLLRFSFIHSILVDIPTVKFIELITPNNFPHLEYLRIGYASTKIPLDQFHQNIFSNQFQFLKKCSLNNLNYTKPWTGSPSIRSLGIWSDNPHTIIERVLFASMNLTSLQLFLNWPSTYLILPDQIIPQHMNLRTLNVHLSGVWTLEKLDSFFAYIPNVKNLSLYTSYFDSHMVYFQWNFKELAYVFVSRLPNLSYFDCEFIQHDYPIIDLISIHSLHACFNRMKYETYFEDDSFIRIFTEKQK